MNKRDQLLTLKNQIQKIENNISNLQNESYELRDKRDTIASEVILEENLLEGTTWEIESFEGRTYLTYKGNIRDAEFAQVADLTWSGWHSWFSLEEGIQIRFDDSVASLHFDDPKLLVPFAKRHKIIVSGQQIVDRLRELKREASALEAINHQFNLKG